MKTALCISGGSLDGFCLGVGVLLALEDRGVLDANKLELHGKLDCYGTSAGAALACWVAAGRPIGLADGLAAQLRALRDADIRDPRPLWQARMAWIDNIWDGRKLRTMLHRLMPSAADLRATAPTRRWHAYAVPMSAAAAMDVAFGCYHGHDAPADVCAASMALPMIFPPVALADGKAYQDGGTACNLPLPANPHAYDRIVCVVLSGAQRKYQAPRSVLSGALTQIGRLLAGQTETSIAWARTWPHCTIIRPPFDGAGGMLHLDHRMIEAGAKHTSDQLEREGLK